MESHGLARILEAILNQIGKLPPAFTVEMVVLLMALHFVAKILKESKTDKPDNGLGKHAVVVVTTIAVCIITSLASLVFLGKL